MLGEVAFPPTMTRAERLRQVFLKHLNETPCLDRIEYVETTMDRRTGRTSYIGWIRVLTK